MLKTEIARGASGHVVLMDSITKVTSDDVEVGQDGSGIATLEMLQAIT
jgi:hypothetical protein